MKIKNRKALKWLKLFHILTSSIWFGGVVCIGVLAQICFFAVDESAFLTIAPLLPSLYAKVIMPAALVTIAQGLVYGAFTGWGFFKHKWIVLKWISVITVMLCTGIGAISELYSVIEKVRQAGFSGGFADGGVALSLIAVQIVIMAFMVGISVLKPFGTRVSMEK